MRKNLRTRKNTKKQQALQEEAVKKDHVYGGFEDPIFIHRVICTLNFDFIHQYLGDICRLFSDSMFLEKQLVVFDDVDIHDAYEKILHESRDLLDALFLSEKQPQKGVVDKKYGEHLIFRSQDALRNLVEAFW